jgi:long-chain fatty acid transport protein
MATNGYFSHGYGIKSKGMGGVGIALPQDAMAAAT